MDDNKVDLVLSVEEIIKITHRKRAAEQLRDLLALGIPATKRYDNTICVLRADVTTRRGVGHPAGMAASGAPQRKSAKQ